MPQYRLPKHVRVCAMKDSVIFFDMHRGVGKYKALVKQARFLSHTVQGWPIQQPLTEQDKQDALAASAQLEGLGLLTLDTDGDSAAPVKIDPVSATLVEKGVAVPSIKAGHVLRFAIALLRAKTSLRFLPLIRMVNFVERRKEQALKHPVPIDLEMTCQLMSIYRALRPFFFTVKEACLLDSLCLIHFLAGYRIYPLWVIGVKNTPFKAHSWVQDARFVFNGTPDAVLPFTPIVAK